MSEKIPEAFDIWVCTTCRHRFERNIKFVNSRPKCPKCHTVKLSYIGQVAR